MPKRNNTQDILSELNTIGSQFGFGDGEVLNYQNLKKSTIVMRNVKKEKIVKSAQSWRVFFSNLEKLKKSNAELAFEKAQKTSVQQNEEKAYFKVLEKAKERSHVISEFHYNGGVKNCIFTVFCTIHNKLHKKIRFSAYLGTRTRFGLPCCSSTLRKKKGT